MIISMVFFIQLIQHSHYNAGQGPNLRFYQNKLKQIVFFIVREKMQMIQLLWFVCLIIYSSYQRLGHF